MLGPKTYPNRAGRYPTQLWPQAQKLDRERNLELLIAAQNSADHSILNQHLQPLCNASVAPAAAGPHAGASYLRGRVLAAKQAYSHERNEPGPQRKVREVGRRKLCVPNFAG
jgi:hypothetical protein